MDWIAIVALIVDIIQECRDEGVDEQTIRKRSRDGLIRSLVVRRAVRQATGYRGSQLRRAVTEANQKMAEMSDVEIDEILDSAFAEWEPADIEGMDDAGQ